jgi:membrane protein YqaA with SNARE-associated domain
MSYFNMKTEDKKLALKIGLLIAIGIFFAITVGFIFFREEMNSLTKAIVDQFGLFGLFSITVIMDTIIQPISPDVLTLGFSMANLNFLTVAIVGGTASILAGFIGYSIGHFLKEEGVDKFIGQKNYQKAHTLFVKHGFWAILIGSISPVPFSAICWSAGVFKMPWKIFCISIVITRLPRFLLAGYIGTLL